MDTNERFSRYFKLKARLGSLAGVSLLPLMDQSVWIPVAILVAVASTITVVFEEPLDRPQVAIALLLTFVVSAGLAWLIPGFLFQLVSVGIVALGSMVYLIDIGDA
jgi:hypothetical protein